MTSTIIISCIFLYFSVLVLISYFTSKNVNSKSYFDGDKKSPWYAVAFGMIGDSLSGVTFISVPGSVLLIKFGYLQLVFGYFFGYLLIIYILLPLYYRMNLTSIYTFLQVRFGNNTQKIGSFYFILSRLIGSAARLYLAASVFQYFLFDSFGIPFWITLCLIIFLIWVYTVKGGIKTLVWTDTFQSLMLLFGVICSLIVIINNMDLNLSQFVVTIFKSEYSNLFVWDKYSKINFFKQFIGGIFIAATMTGLDQNMMQKNLSINTLKSSQKNIFWFSVVLIFTNLFFLSLGVLLFEYAEMYNISLPIKQSLAVDTDKVFPFLAFNHLGIFAGIAFVLGLTAATFSSADSVLTTLTTSYYIDFLNLDTSKDNKKIRIYTHILFALILLFCILIINILNDSTIIDLVLLIANYTYGPLLGLFMFGIITKRKVSDKYIWIFCFLAPIITFFIDKYIPILLYNIEHQKFLLNTTIENSSQLFAFGNTILLVNGLLTFAFLWVFSKKITLH